MQEERNTIYSMKICMTIRRGCPSEQEKVAFIDFFVSILLETIPESEREKRSVAKRPFRQSQFSLPFKFIDFFVWHSSGARGEGGKKAYFTPMHRILLRKKKKQKKKKDDFSEIRRRFKKDSFSLCRQIFQRIFPRSGVAQKAKRVCSLAITIMTTTN